MGSDNVVHAFGSTPPDELQAEMLAEIEAFVSRVKAGHVVGVAIAAVTQDGGVTTGWARQNLHHFALVGAIERLKMRLIKSEYDE